MEQLPGLFDARTKLYDFYGLPPYEDNREFYESIGLSQESYTLLENYNFALDDSIDTWRLEAIVAYQEEMARQHVDVGTGLEDTFGFVSKNSVGEAVWLYKNQLFRDLQVIALLVSGGRHIFRMTFHRGLSSASRSSRHM